MLESYLIIYMFVQLGENEFHTLIILTDLNLL